MREIFGIIIVGGMLFFPILYYIIRSAVEDGTTKALLKYKSMENKQSISVNNKS